MSKTKSALMELIHGKNGSSKQSTAVAEAPAPTRDALKRGARKQIEDDEELQDDSGDDGGDNGGEDEQIELRPIVIPALRLAEVVVRINGTSPLITHPWSKKALRMIADKVQGNAVEGRQDRNFQSEFEESCYYVQHGDPKRGIKPIYGLPSNAFKQAAVTAVTSLKMKRTVSKTLARQAFHMFGVDRADLVTIEGDPILREDVVRIKASGGADIRIRAEFPEWSTQIRVQYNTLVLSPQQIIHLLNVAGFGVGVGEWRPEKNGNFGQFTVET